MCGIAGWYSWSQHRLSRERITTLWVENEFRGREAAGVAYVKEQSTPSGRSPTRQIMYVKQKGTATELARAIDNPTWDTISQSPLGLLHTRAPTVGSPNENANNHPVLGYGWVVVHNGGVYNDNELFKHFRAQGAAERPAAVDTAAINLVLGQGQTVEESLPHACTLRGSVSVAAAHVSKPDEVVLFRLGGQPVHIYWLPGVSMLVWSSDSDGGKAIEDIPGNGFVGMSQAYLLPNKTALHLTPTGVKRYELTPKPYGTGYRVYSGSAGYGGGNLGVFPGTGKTGKTRSMAGGHRDHSKKPPIIPQGQYSLAVLVDNTGLLEEPLFQGSRQEYHFMSRYAAYVPNEGSFVLPTGYGRWCLTRTPDGVAREFKPHRRVRRRWDHEFGETSGNAAYVVSLPASSEQQDDLSDLLSLAQVDLVFADSTSSPAYICPWCGVLRHPEGWNARAHACEWCNVKSRPPKQVSEEVNQNAT